MRMIRLSSRSATVYIDDAVARPLRLRMISEDLIIPQLRLMEDHYIRGLFHRGNGWGERNCRKRYRFED